MDRGQESDEGLGLNSKFSEMGPDEMKAEAKRDPQPKSPYAKYGIVVAVCAVIAVTVYAALGLHEMPFAGSFFLVVAVIITLGLADRISGVRKGR